MQVSDTSLAHLLWSRFTPLTHTGYAVDEGNSEVLLKKLKRVEDKLRKSNDSNKVLMTEVKTLRQKPAPTSSRIGNDDGLHTDAGRTDSSDSDSDVARQSDDPAQLFSSRRVLSTSTLCTLSGQLIPTNR